LGDEKVDQSWWTYQGQLSIARVMYNTWDRWKFQDRRRSSGHRTGVDGGRGLVCAMVWWSSAFLFLWSTAVVVLPTALRSSPRAMPSRVLCWPLQRSADVPIFGNSKRRNTHDVTNETEFQPRVHGCTWWGSRTQYPRI